MEKEVTLTTNPKNEIFNSQNTKMFARIKSLFRKENKRITVKIEIKGNEIEITTPNAKERKQLTIRFNQNEIEIGNGGIDIVNATETTLIQYQGEEYELTPDELLAIYLDLIIREIEMKWIITHVEMTEENPTLVRALQKINMRMIKIEGEEREMKELEAREYEKVERIIEKQRKYQRFKKQIERMQLIMKETNDTSHPELVQLKPNDSYSENKMEEIKKGLTCSERTKYKLCHLG